MYTFCYWMVFRNAHPPKKTDVGKSWPLRRVASCSMNLDVVFDPPWQNDFRPEIFVVFFWSPPLRSSDYMSVKIWPPMLPICQDWTCLGGQKLGIFGVLLFFFAIGRCFLLTIWSMAGHTSPNNFVFLLVLFRLVRNREAKKTMDVCLVCGFRYF